MSDISRLLRAFTDPKKLKLLGLICDEALPLHTLARMVGLSETETIKHVGVLEEAGLLVKTFAADGFRWQYQPKPVFEALASLRQESKPVLEAEWMSDEAKVLGDFFVNGRLQTIPAQRKKRDIVLRYLAQRFEFGRTYTEQDVNFVLLDYHDDYASLRREMVDTKLMAREKGIYRRLPAV